MIWDTTCTPAYGACMEQRITLVTLGVLDLARSKSFYEALGWRGQEVEETVFFQAGGLGLVLWDRDKLAADCGLEPSGSRRLRRHRAGAQRPIRGGGRRAARRGRACRRHRHEAAATNAIGFYSGAFVDPDGHPWEVAHNPGFPLAEDGSVTIPDFGAA